ncbi:MAG: histidine kinase [Flavobacteriaceae bacterium]|nr:histidine kinase [Flavobacteriaceae bacterium]
MFLDLDSEFFSWVRGALIVLFVFHALLYINNRQKLFLYYSIYTLFFSVNLIFWNSRFANDNTIFLISLPQFYIAIYIYFLFSREVLNIKKAAPQWDKRLKKIALFLFALSLFTYITQFFISKNVFYVINGLLLFTVIYFILSTHQKIKSVNFALSTLFILGTLSLLILSTLSIFVASSSELKYYFQSLGINEQTFIYLGASIEIFVFAIILGYRITSMENEEVAVNLKLVRQLAETEELRMEMLKSQMNPHFIFNMLNSINSLIIKNQIENASDYITKFSRFIREILNSSRKNSMSLADELNIIKLYIILEQARVDGGFSFEVIIEDDISPNFIQIPPMFLQPFIENAIWHGLAHQQGEKKLIIKLRKENEFYLLEVIDNGVGYKKGIEIAQKRLVKSSGIAVEIVKNRLQSLYKNETTDVLIEDLTNDTISGTKVTFKFPMLS